MQFIYPGLLWALLLLLIPIIIHLFQLRRFKKTPFTNVRLLQKVVAQTRRSQQLKKWLLLISRLGLVAALVFAFAQPFLASQEAGMNRETVIYIDDSFSMQAQASEASLLRSAVQDLYQAANKDQLFSVITNTREYRQVSLGDIQNELLGIRGTGTQLSLDEVYTKAAAIFSDNENTVRELILISDFQSRMGDDGFPSNSDVRIHLATYRSANLQNIAIDSLYIQESSPELTELEAELSAVGYSEAVPVSLYSGDQLIAKTSANFDNENRSEVSFSITGNELENARLEITDQGLSYDNELFFNLDPGPQINVLAIENTTDDFLERIFSDTSFTFTTSRADAVNYSILANQQLIVLNQLRGIPASLANALESFKADGGSIVIIPPSQPDMATYNSFLGNYMQLQLRDTVALPAELTGINFAHPLYSDVFEEEVTNFEYPRVAQHFKVSGNAPTVLELQNGNPFLSGIDGFYLFSAPLNLENSNFVNSPLIVPTFYNMGALSLQIPPLYFQLQSNTTVDVPVVLPSDRILNVVGRDYQFVPQQRAYSQKVSLIFSNEPEQAGGYRIQVGDSLLSGISFNHSRAESQLSYLETEPLGALISTNSLGELFGELESNYQVKALWKWFVILALLFALAEVFIQKLIK